jgi:uncharacterized protein YgiB involved in biofilm formation
MKAVAILLIAGITGFMAYLGLVGECPGGTVVRSQQQCREALSQVICEAIFARAKDVAENSNTVYMNPTECSAVFGSCMNNLRVVGGYSPTPARFCVKSSGNTVTSIDPIYQRAGAR